MRALGFLISLLLANQALSSPVPTEQSKADAKVMKCVVEVISATLSKPGPLPISQECLEALRADDRINSVLRHQNLLQELQELAVEGANEKALQIKQKNDYKDKLSAAVKSHRDKKISSADKSQENPTEEQQGSSAEIVRVKDKEEQDSIEGTQPNVSEHSFLDDKDTTTDSNSDETDSRDMTTEKKDETADDPMKRGSTENESVAEQSQDQSRSEEQSTEESEQSEDEYTQEAEVDEDQFKEHEEEDEEENQSLYDDSKDEELANGDEPSQEDRGDAETKEEDRSQSEDRDHSEVEGDGKISEEERRFNEDNMSHQNSEDEEIEEDEYSNNSDEKDRLSEEEWEKSKKWKMMDELAPERNARNHGEMSDEDTGVLEGKGKTIGSGNQKSHNKLSHSQHSWGIRRSHSEEDIREKGKKKPIASYLGRKRLDVEDKREKEEEGSANRKNEEQEVENLEEIENELEAMARRLHQMRS